jgi:SAM-dependent methyltransferase
MRKILNVFFARDKRVCPSWCCFTFDNFVRRLFQDPVRILSPYVRAGSIAIDIGSGKGFFSGALCHLVGDRGRVIAVDIQQRMLDSLVRRVQRRGLAERLETHLSSPDEFGITSQADFILAFWMVHEVPDQTQFFEQVAHLLKPTGTFLVAEPYLHVTKRAFSRTVEMAVRANLKTVGSPRIAFSRTALFSLAI